MHTVLKAMAVLIAGLLAIAWKQECPAVAQEQAQPPAKQGQPASQQALLPPPASPPSAVGYQPTIGVVGTGTSMIFMFRSIA